MSKKNQKIKIGWTNNSFYKDGFFYQEKNKNGFNHKSDYSQLEQFDFVPKLIKNTNDFSVWEWIDGKSLDSPSLDDLKQLAKILYKLHNSKVQFSQFNIRKRIDKYRKIMKEKNVKIEIVDRLYRKINLILKMMDKTKPVHGDLYRTNILKSKNDKLYLIDWEYSHMGDIHYELAYIIEAYEFDEQQQKTFLDTYQHYDPIILQKHKVLVNYLTILWLYSNDKLYFSPEFCIKKLEKLEKEGF